MTEAPTSEPAPQSTPGKEQQPNDDSVIPTLKDLFAELKLVSDGFLESSHEDFMLLTKMNELAAEKYNKSAEDLEASSEVLAQIFEKLKLFQPHFDQIEQIEFSLNNLETLAKSLDDYSRLLELRFRRL